MHSGIKGELNGYIDGAAECRKFWTPAFRPRTFQIGLFSRVGILEKFFLVIKFVKLLCQCMLKHVNIETNSG